MSEENMLSLRVMRLNRPVFVRQQCEPAELYLDDIAGSLTAADAGVRADLDGVALHRLEANESLASEASQLDALSLESTASTKPIQMGTDLVRVKVGGPGELLSLPQSFGSAYLGETFSAHVNLYNESNDVCHNVELKVSLHNRIEWITLHTSSSLTGASFPTLSPSDSSGAIQRASGSIGGGGGGGTTSTTGVDLLPGHSLNAVIHHELKELGVHTLRCAASYCLDALVTPPVAAATRVGSLTTSSPDSTALEPFTFQRLYKFPVSKPLDVKKKFSAVETDGSVLMEAHVQNLTSAPIFLERVMFEPSGSLTVIDLNAVDSNQNLSTSCQLKCLRPDDVRQFLYRLTPSPHHTHDVSSAAASLLTSKTTGAGGVRAGAAQRFTTPLVGNQAVQPPNPPMSAGRLDITWRSIMGERGRLQTSSLKYEIPSLGDLHLSVAQLPATVQTEKPFRVVFELTNRGSNHADLLLNLRTLGLSRSASKALSSLCLDGLISEESSGPQTPASCLPALVWLGLTTRHLGTLPPGRSIPVPVDLMATLPGLQTISGLLIHENTTDRDYEFNDLGHVLVCSA